MWGTMHQTMHRLAGPNRVLYVEEPVTMLAPLKVPALWRRWRHLIPRVGVVESGLWALTLPPLLPFGNMRPAVNRINQRVTAGYVRWAMRRLGFTRRPILWAYLPGSVELLDHLEGRFAPGLVVYHCVDEHSAFPGLLSPDVVPAYDRALTERADVVIATAESLAASRRAFNPNTHTVLNAADVELFSLALDPATAVPADVAAIPEPRLMVVGALDYRLDIDALELLAASDPSWHVVLVGPVKTPELTARLRQRANIHLLGEKPHAEIPGCLRGAAVAMIPYRATALTENIFPLKLFEYLAAGVPVVVGGLPELRRLSGAIGVAEKPEDYPGLVRRALADDGPEKRAERAQMAAGNSWDSRTEEISGLVEEALRLRDVRS
jgi:glycosyltransferase involved in cell wall biosynthesis